MRTIRLQAWFGDRWSEFEAFLLCPTFDHKSFVLYLYHAMSKLKRRDSFHDTTAETIDQETIDMSKYFDKVVLIVNVASR